MKLYALYTVFRRQIPFSFMQTCEMRKKQNRRNNITLMANTTAEKKEKTKYIKLIRLKGVFLCN